MSVKEDVSSILKEIEKDIHSVIDRKKCQGMNAWELIVNAVYAISEQLSKEMEIADKMDKAVVPRKKEDWN